MSASWGRATSLYICISADTDAEWRQHSCRATPTQMQSVSICVILFLLSLCLTSYCSFPPHPQQPSVILSSVDIRHHQKYNWDVEIIFLPIVSVLSLVKPMTLGNAACHKLVLILRHESQYYKYVLETPFALTGSHNLAKATAKGNTVVVVHEKSDGER
ncbi:hypothetical protein MUK42_11970 [Musa troglodytarum]|uniref:Uncharacterized protein n=1 Tax=Musa troglodytarum TaxID=320322 RepID=A0A9E7KFT9_9LILI|nr:hypothetical protein MUK42_11970 [Musa troglodytarum]